MEIYIKILKYIEQYQNIKQYKTNVNKHMYIYIYIYTSGLYIYICIYIYIQENNIFV